MSGSYAITLGRRANCRCNCILFEHHNAWFIANDKRLTNAFLKLLNRN